MIYKLSLSNCEEELVLDAEVLHFLETDPDLSAMDFIQNLRRHDRGIVVYQKSQKTADGGYLIETIYLHRLIAERFLTKPSIPAVLKFKNGNKLDCRLDNLEYHIDWNEH